jgi:hypothetical protein
VDETRIEPYLVASVLAIVERARNNANNWNRYGTGAAMGAGAVAVLI